MNRLKERMKAETQKYSQRFFGSESGNTDDTHHQLHQQQQQQQHDEPHKHGHHGLEPHKLHFQQYETAFRRSIVSPAGAGWIQLAAFAVSALNWATPLGPRATPETWIPRDTTHPGPPFTALDKAMREKKYTKWHDNFHDAVFQCLPIPQSSANNTTGSSDIQIANVTELGDVHSLTTNVARDLGFAGQIGQHVLLSYGDTIYADKNNSCDKFRGMTSNSVAIATHDPLQVVDSKLNQYGWPEQFVPVIKEWGEDMATHAVGITNVVETNPDAGEGVVFTLLNHRPDGKDHIIGAGLARVNLSPEATPVPHANRVSQYIWDGETEPHYGDVGALRTQDYIYAYGHMKDNPWVYVTRVPVADVLDVNCYEYWHGQAKGWSKDRLIGADVGEDQSVFWQVNQGQVFWSPYYNKFLFVYCDNFWSSTLLLRSASAPEGPWSDVINVYKAKPVSENGTIYAAVPHPYLDASGKSLVITYTNHPNVIQAVRVEFG